MYNNKIQDRTDGITTIVSNIYRVLAYYKSDAYDYYSNELRYRDRGLTTFWTRMLEDRNLGISQNNRDRLARLISDLQNPEISVTQKMEFIKLEWGKNLFGSTCAAV